MHKSEFHGTNLTKTTTTKKNDSQSDFSRSTLGPVEGGALLGFAEVRVVRVTAPQLLTWVECAKL